MTDISSRGQTFITKKGRAQQACRDQRYLYQKHHMTRGHVCI